MARIITNEDMKDNIYRNIFEPLVAAYNTTQITKPNPHEVWLVTTMLRLRSNYWGGNIPIPGANFINDGGGGGGVSTTACCKKGICNGCKGIARQGAQNDGSGANSPVSQLVETLDLQLRTINMSQPNGWQQWSAGLDYFFTNTSTSLMYFTYDYKDGNYANFYEEAAGLFNHPNSYKTGLQFGVEAEGTIGPDTFAGFSIDYWCPTPATDLANRFFVIYDTAGLSTLFYFDLDAAGTFVTPPSLTPDAEIAIPIVTGMSREEIALASKAVLEATGLLLATISGTKITYSYKIAGPVADFDTGTSSFGVNYVYNDLLLGSDGSTLATGIASPEEYATEWNDKKVPFETTQGKVYPYLDPNITWIGAISKTGGSPTPCGTCTVGVGGITLNNYRCWQGNGTTTSCASCVSCTTASTSSVFRTSPYLTYNIPNYNTPGNIFLIEDSRLNNLTPIDELI